MTEPAAEPSGRSPSGPSPAETIRDLITASLDVSRGQDDDGTSTGEIRSIMDAMVRLLTGVPLRSDGKLTIKSLAEEAGLRRNKLTHKHAGLKDLFYALVKAQQSRPVIADQLQRDNDELRARIQHLKEERDQLKQALHQFARIVHVLEAENATLWAKRPGTASGRD
ncbi:MAG: hypothetical protein ACRDPY_39810, partial [Streptosporangiaceae bacterium]